MSNPVSNPDGANGNYQEDNNTDKTESREGTYQRLRRFSTLDGATILQVDATVIVLVLVIPG